MHTHIESGTNQLMMPETSPIFVPFKGAKEKKRERERMIKERERGERSADCERMQEGVFKAARFPRFTV